ncbi:MAG: tetratricopeptide repeat-containing sensor histidine kinase [Prevotellaceae bacterium]|jgi:signal transduction histidine kinase|nr:tetratricopeptide repeat-containing sensor histidine kinase [Prevotellaceae bacterium]
MKKQINYPQQLTYYQQVKKLVIILFLCLPLFSNMQAQTEIVDSLENVIKTQHLKGNDLVAVYLELSWEYNQIDAKKMRETAFVGIKLAEKENNFYDENEFYRNIAMSYYRNSQCDSALYYYNIALDCVEKMKLVSKYTEKEIDDAYSMTYGNIGNLYAMQGKNLFALEYYQKALALFEKHDWKQSSVRTYNNIAQLYTILENYKQAEIYARKGEKTALELNDSILMVYNSRHLCAVYLYQEEYQKALKSAEMSKKILDKHPEQKMYIINNYLTLSAIWLDGFNEIDKAISFAKLALKEAEIMNVPHLKCESMRRLAKAYLAKGDYYTAEQIAINALKTDSTLPSANIELYECLLKANIKLGNTNKAIDYLDKYNKTKREYVSSSYQSSLSEMEVKYETEKKESEIARQKQTIKNERIIAVAAFFVILIILIMLWYMLRLRKKKNLILKEANDTKDKFFNIISHDLKNPAIMQQNALRMLLDDSSNLDKKSLKLFYEELVKSADNQVELLYNLLNWAQISTGRMPFVPIDFNLAAKLNSDISLIKSMTERKEINFSVEMPEEAMIFGDSNMICTVIRNLLTNAVKFTEKGGTITLAVGAGYALPSLPLHWRISIYDNGIGMTAEQISDILNSDKKQSQQGTAGETGSGLGLIVCRELLEKHNSKLHIESEEGKGSRFWFEI